MVPAVIYGRDLEPISVAVDAHDLYLALHTDAGVNALINLETEGADAQLTMAREVQRHPVRGDITHVDFLKISLTEKTQVEVAIEITGESVGVKEGGIVETIRNSIHVEALPTGIPQSIVVDISELAIGDTLRIGDLPAMDGVEYLGDEDDPVVIVVAPAAAEVEAVEEELEEGAEEEGAEAEDSEEADASADE
jgi:large subunit ribosomal protein L25